MIKYVLFPLFFCFFVSTYAADVNATLIDGNNTVYKTLFEQLGKESNDSVEVQLQRSLLQTLVAHPKPVKLKERHFKVPQNSNAYKTLFSLYLEDAIAEDLFQNKLAKNFKKIKIIETEIIRLDKKDPKLRAMQLQDALYYHKTLLYKSKIAYYQKELEQLKKLLNDSLKTIQIDRQAVSKEIEEKTLLSTQLQFDISKLKIKKEQSELLSQSGETRSIDVKIKKIERMHTHAMKETAALQFLLFAESLQERENSAFTFEKKISGILTQISENRVVRNRVLFLLESMEKNYLGQIMTLEGSGVLEAKVMLRQGWSFLNQPIFTINKTPVSVFKLLLALAVLIFGIIIGGVYKDKIKNISLSRRSLTTSSRTLLANIGYYIILLIAFFVALNVMGITLSSLALVAGALSVGIGFGLKNIVSNLVSGLILMFERSIKIGDFVEISDELSGYVTDIRMRSTTINTNDNIDVIIPNQNFIENKVINWTMNDNLRRFHIPFDVKYGTEPKKVIDVVTKAVIESEYMNEVHDSPERRTKVIMTGMGNSSVNFELLLWIQGAKMRRPKRTASEFLIIIYNTLYENNIEIPFPQLDLHVRSMENGLSVMKSE